MICVKSNVKNYFFLFLCCLVCALSGCATSNRFEKSRLNAYELMREGAIVHWYGQHVNIILPNKYLFEGHTKHVSDNYSSLLQLVSSFINRMDVTTLRVSSYMPATVKPVVANAVSSARAKMVAYSLKSLLPRVPIVVGKGYGSRFPVATSGSYADSLENGRIEISYRYIYPH